MHRWTDPDRTPEQLRPSVVALGNFDGVHRGHRAVLGTLVELGRERGLPTVAVTFEPHPVAVLHPERAPALLTPGHLRDDLLAATGIDGLLVLPFTREFAAQTPEEFVRATFVDALSAAVVVVGKDTRFGVRNSGDVDTLRQLGEKLGFEVVALDDVGDGARFSSSAVRAALVDGDVAGAARILGRPHRVVGTVVHGHHRGRDLGYPTANLGADSLGLVPAEGVYAGWLTRLDLPLDAPDRTLPAAVSIGTNPTFATKDRRTVEAYVLDRTDLDLYDEHVMVEFVEHIRPTLRFESIDDLCSAMAKDVEASRRILTRIVPS
ncbi:bifunctional riboflavin kinase/FAD synthetase [Nostocoides japonicum]|uniref:bifunctional riboflavin kinase/FAD synthetase n=1 Tax=Nostocoides japonicum TaxID=99481 RepID=UPI00065BA630|nr:bifunctional riboflavin kinase/FAD synthetase [Tetrasphaera japonica]